MFLGVEYHKCLESGEQVGITGDQRMPWRDRMQQEDLEYPVGWGWKYGRHAERDEPVNGRTPLH